MQIGDNNTITQENVDNFIVNTEITLVGNITLVVATLANGWEIIECHSSGEDYCIKKIKDQVWKLLGFLLQTARYGIKR